MNFWQFLDKDGVGLILFGGSFFAVFSLVVVAFFEERWKHIERMAKIKQEVKDE